MLVRKEKAGSAPGITWDNDGDVQEVPDDLALQLLEIPGGGFTEVHQAPDDDDDDDDGDGDDGGDPPTGPPTDPPADPNLAVPTDTADDSTDESTEVDEAPPAQARRGRRGSK
jgi:hypothetical protein